MYQNLLCKCNHIKSFPREGSCGEAKLLDYRSSDSVVTRNYRIQDGWFRHQIGEGELTSFEDDILPLSAFWWVFVFVVVVLGRGCVVKETAYTYLLGGGWISNVLSLSKFQL